MELGDRVHSPGLRTERYEWRYVQVELERVPGRAEPSPYGGPNTTGKPVIFGNEYRVPELYLRFVDARTGKPVIPKVVNVGKQA